jgi:arylsulfatase A-like enzyme
MALTIDLAPTLLELAGAAPATGTEGRSLVPVLKGSATGWREDFLIEHFSDKVFPRRADMSNQAVCTGRHKFIRYTEHAGMEKVWNLKADPDELTNLVARPVAKAALEDLKSRLTRWTAGIRKHTKP